MKYKVSVIIPVYGVEKYLRQALDSVAAQTLKEIEIIIIDDGSIDGCPAIIDEYALGDPRIIVEHRENGGYGEAVNRGMDLARGEYIAIFEPDDWIEPEMYEELYTLAKENNAPIVKSDYWDESDAGRSPYNLFVNAGLGNVDRNIFPKIDINIMCNISHSIWSAIYRAEFLRENNIRFLETPGAAYQDTSFYFKTNLAAERIFITHKKFYHYRLDAAGASSNAKDRVFCIVDETNEIMRIVEDGNAWALPAAYRDMEGAYMWNYLRLPKDRAEEFAKGVSPSMLAAIDSGAVSSAIMENWQFRRFLHMATAFAPETPPKVSIVVPVYNVEKYIAECMDSITGQTEKDIEIICVDDCGTDASMKIVGEYAARDSRIKIVRREKNGGRSAVRNSGLRVAAAKYLMFCDSDDWMESDMVEKLYKAIVESHADIAMCGIKMEYETEIPEWLSESDANYYGITEEGVFDLDDERKKMNLSLCNKIFNRELTARIGLEFPEGLSYEDAYFCACYFAYAIKICYVKDKLYHYRRRVGSIMSNTFSGKNDLASQHWDIAERIISYYKVYGIIWDYQHYLHWLCHEYYFSCMRYIEDAPARDKITSRVVAFLRANGLAAWLDDPEFLLSRFIRFPKVSVIIPVYNVEPYLRRCLDSVIGQTLTNLEIICVNDCSSDNSERILKEYAAFDNRIKIVNRASNGGLSVARNTGMNTASGEYIYFIDSDDWIDSGYIEEMAKAAIFNNTEIIMNTNIICEFEDGKSKKYEIGISNDRTEVISVTNNMEKLPQHAWDCLFRLSFLRSIKAEFPEGLMHEDIYFFWTVFIRLKKICLISFPAYHYFKRADSLTGQYSRTAGQNVFDWLSILERIYEYYRNNKLLDFKIPFYLLSGIVMLNDNKENEKAFKKLRGLFLNMKNDIIRNKIIYNQFEMLFFNSVVNHGDMKDFYVNYERSIKIMNLRNKILNRDRP
jgi:glycosyltransferase involved in cell wall biosynthesis